VARKTDNRSPVVRQCCSADDRTYGLPELGWGIVKTIAAGSSVRDRDRADQLTGPETLLPADETDATV